MTSPPAQQEILTPTASSTARSARFWVIGLAVIVVVGLIAMLLQRAASGPSAPLDPESAAPHGSLAIVEVLRGRGVEVVVSSSLDQTRAAVGGAPATVLLHDAGGILDAGRRAELAALGTRLVLVDPGLSAISDLAPGVGAAGADAIEAAGIPAGCGIPAAVRAGSIDATGSGYRILDASAGAIGCFPAADDAFVLIEVPEGPRGTVVLGSGSLLSNDRIAHAGNAALALGLLGEDPTLVWYTPGVDDIRAADRLPSIVELTGDWVTPLALLAVLVTIAAGVWRGRRFGPLVVERLPVTVPSHETMEGRARIYERADARLHALDALRIATTARLARRLGLPRGASVDEIIAAAAQLTGRDAAGLAQLLLHEVPTSDAEMLRLSDELVALETEAAQDSTPTTDPRE